MPFISLIIPIYNAEKYLRRCLNSAAEQTLQDMEIILVNDGSTDGSLAICQEFVSRDPRFRLIDKANTGAADSRNQAIAAAQGEYLQFLDSDDWLTSDASEVFASAAKRFDSDLVIADFYRVERDVYTEKQHIRQRGLMTRCEYAAYMMEDPADYYYGVLWNKLYRRSIICSNQLTMDTRLSWSEDFLFNLRFIRYAERFCAVQSPVYYYVKRKGSLVSTEWKKPDAALLRLQLLKHYRELYQSMGLYEENELKINSFVLSFPKDGGVAAPLSHKRKKLPPQDRLDPLPAGFSHVSHTFGPVYDRSSRILILGSFPSVKSREASFYYAHPQNRFWRLIARLTDSPVPETVEEKTALLLSHGIALWDVVAECDIHGSSDLSIRNVIPADIGQILDAAPIQRILANGAAAFRLYQKHCLPRTGRPAVKCPSTSPANAAFSLDRLTSAWSAAMAGPFTSRS